MDIAHTNGKLAVFCVGLTILSHVEIGVGQMLETLVHHRFVMRLDVLARQNTPGELAADAAQLVAVALLVRGVLDEHERAHLRVARGRIDHEPLQVPLGPLAVHQLQVDQHRECGGRKSRLNDHLPAVAEAQPAQKHLALCLAHAHKDAVHDPCGLVVRAARRGAVVEDVVERLGHAQVRAVEKDRARPAREDKEDVGVVVLVVKVLHVDGERRADDQSPVHQTW